MRNSVFAASLLGVSCPITSPVPIAHASSAPADSVHVCLPFDYEQWRRDHPRPVAKRLADLDMGESRTVRMSCEETYRVRGGRAR